MNRSKLCEIGLILCLINSSVIIIAHFIDVILLELEFIFAFGLEIPSLIIDLTWLLAIILNIIIAIILIRILIFDVKINKNE